MEKVDVLCNINFIPLLEHKNSISLFHFWALNSCEKNKQNIKLPKRYEPIRLPNGRTKVANQKKKID